MRESISITTIFQIVILFILLFTAIMALTINNSNAFGVKDQIVNIIETNRGQYKTGESLDDEIVDLLANTSYRTTGKCSDGFTGFDRTGAMVSSDKQASVCIKEVDVTKGLDNYLNRVLQGNVATGDFMPGKYYQVEVFFQLDLPVVKQIYNFKSKAETKVIYQGK